MADAPRWRIRSAWLFGGIGASLGVAAAVVAAVLLLNPPIPDTVSSPLPTRSSTSASGPTLTTERLDGLSTDLRSGDTETLSRVLALPSDEITADVSEGFAGVDIVWDAAAAEPLEDAGRSIVGWNVPAVVTQPDRSTTSWIVTVVPEDDHLIFIDSIEVPR